MASEEDDIPLMNVKAASNQLCRTTSCFSEPQESALSFVLDDDLEKLTSVLAEVSLVSDTCKFHEALPEGHWLNQPFGNEAKFRSLLHLALEKKPEERAEKFGRVILSAGARPDLYNEQLGVAPIHVAAKQGYLSIVRMLVDFASKMKPSINLLNSVDNNGSTVLHIAVANKDPQLLRYLLTRDDIDIDPEDFTGRQTPLYLAVKSKQEEAVKLLIGNGASLKNSCHGKNIQDLIQENWQHLNPEKICVPRQRPIKEDIGMVLQRILDKASMNKKKKLSNAQNYLHFTCLIRKISKKELNTYNAGGMTLFQKGCEYGLQEFVSCMLDSGADPNSISDECSSTPALLAAYSGHDKVLQVLIDHKQNSTDFSVCEKSSGESVLHWVLKRPHPDQTYAQYESCLEVLMSSDSRIVEELKRRINTKDSYKNTPLHYATQLWPQEVVRRILELGANIGIRNLRDEIPISKILPSTMESFLNEFCVKSHKPVTDGDFELTFNYSFLAPPVDSKEYDERDEEGQKIVERAALPETESLWYMSMSKPHRHLLKHPVVTSFLHLKWSRIYGYFNRNLRFYVMFVLCSTWYIFERYGGIALKSNTINGTNETSFCDELSVKFDQNENIGFWYILFAIHFVLQALFMASDWNRELFSAHGKNGSRACCILNVFFASWLETLTLTLMGIVLYFSTSALWYVITILLVLLIAREAFQMSVSLKRYACTPENWLEISVIGLMGFILWIPDDFLTNPCDVKRHLAAIAIVASWAEFVTFVARHPRLAMYNIYVTMFYKVLKTFFFFLIWYSFFVVAFALGFYIMLHRDTSYSPEEKKEEEYPFFDDPFLSMIKTMTMFVGEIEFSDIPIQGPMLPVSYLFLLSFVFLIIVVLMNLLNGLAVSDTGMIREKAEAVSHSSRVDTISYIESLLLGDPFDFLSNWPPFRWLRSLPSMSLCRCLCQRNDAMRSLTHKLTGATGILIFYSILSEKTLTVYPNKNNGVLCRQGSHIDIPRDILDFAKNIIIEKEEQDRQRRHADQAEDRFQSLENSIKRIMEALKIKG